MSADPTNVSALRYDTVTLISDYGTADGSVGVIHSVLRQLAPGVGIVDLTHEIEPFDVRGAALTLARSVQFLCPGVIIGLVDPSVGTEQRAVAIEVADGAGVLLGPDNGLLAPAVGMLGGATRAVVLDDVERHLPSASPTFSGRDVFAPVAAHLCNGVDLTDVGTEIDPALLMPGLVPLTNLETDDDGTPLLSAEVLWVDRFGNVQLNVDPDELDGWGDTVRIRVGEGVRATRRVSTYGDLSAGELGLVVDAHGLIAVVADRRSAADELSAGLGDEVTLMPIGDDAPTGVRTAVTLGRARAGVDPADPPLDTIGGRP